MYKHILKAAGRLSSVAIGATTIITAIIMLSCGEDPEDIVTKRPEGAANTLGEMKTPEAVAAAPQAANAGVPFVKEVNHYNDWKLTKEVDTVTVGDTIYTKVVFSEPMKHVAADNKDAHPILYYKVGKNLTRFHITEHGSKGDDFVSGDAKPEGKGTHTFVCKYVTQMDDAGTFTFSVGKLSADVDGTTLSAFYTHKEKVQIREPDTTPPFVRSVTYWHDAHLTQPITDTVYGGENIYTKIVFSEEVKVVEGNNKASRPVLYYRTDRQNIRYRIRLSTELLDGGARTEDGVTFTCRNIVPDTADGTLQTMVGKLSADQQGNTLSAFYTHRERVEMKTHRPPTVLPGSGVQDITRRPCVRLVYFRPRDYPIKPEIPETLRTLVVDANKYYADEMQRHGFGRKTFAVETDADGVPVVHVIRGKFNENHYRTTKRLGVGAKMARNEVEEFFEDALELEGHTYCIMMDSSAAAFSRDPSYQGCGAFGGLRYFVDNRSVVRNGYVILPAPERCPEHLPVMLHELGHAFGLHHDFREGRHTDYIMAYGRQTRLSQDAAEWLSVSTFFNDTASGVSPGKITMVSDPEHTPQGIRVKFQAEDQDGLHQIKLAFEEAGYGYALVDFEQSQGVVATAEFVSPKLTRAFTNKLTMRIIDKRGDITVTNFPPID